jgi:DNA-binding CsgD family transcriptional regulator
MPLVERALQLRSLAEYADEARQDDGRFVLVSGEAGIGKSSLLEELERALPGARWWWGACDGLFTPRPLGPVHDIEPLAHLLDEDLSREHLFQGILTDLAAEFTVLVVEDIHWADEATLDLLRFLSRRLRRVPALVVATYRDDALAPHHPLVLALGELSIQRATRRINLPPLTLSAVARLCEGSGREAQEVRDLTGGNPFFVAEVLRVGRSSLPGTARDAVLARLATVDDAGLTAAHLAALAGPRIASELYPVLGPPSAVDQLLGCGLLDGSGRELRWRHEIARRTVEESMPAHHQQDGHARILRALLDSGSTDHARIAHHAGGSGDAGTVLEQAPLAAELAAAVPSHREALAHYRLALRFADGAPTALRARLADAAAEQAAVVDLWDESATWRRAALELWHDLGDTLREGDSLCRLSRALWHLCDGRGSMDASRRGLALVEPHGDTPEFAQAAANMAAAYLLDAQVLPAVNLARKAIGLAARLGLPDVRSDALRTEAGAARSQGLAWERPMQRALEVAVEAGLPRQAGAAYTAWADGLIDQLQFPAASQVLAEGLALCEQHDVPAYANGLVGERVRMLELTGRWDEAAADARRHLAKPVLSVPNRLHALVSLARILVRRGQDADDLVAEAADAAESIGDPQWRVPARLLLAERCWLTGDAEEARRHVRAAALAARSGPTARGLVATWQRRLGLPAVEPITEPWTTWLSGDADATARAFDERGAPYAAATALLDGGTEASLRAALARFEALGAQAAAEHTRTRMRAAGLRAVPLGGRSSTRAHPLGLTRREQQILVLLSGGDTNDEIARHLFISVRTVDHHVSAILAKLGVGNRREAAAAARRHGLRRVPPEPAGGT